MLTFRIAAITFLSGFLCISASAQLKLTTSEDDLKGRVRTVQTNTAEFRKDYPDTNFVERQTSVETISYDRQGRRNEEYSGPLRNDSSTKQKEIYVYESNRLKEIVHYDEEGKIENSYAASYDEQGRLIGMIGTARMNGSPFGFGGGADFESRITFAYSNTGKTLRYTARSKEAPADFPYFIDSISVYDRGGKLVDQKINMVGSLINHETYTYDSNGHLIRMIDSNPQDHTGAEELYTNDEHGNPVEIKRYGRLRHALERKTLLTYEYDVAGNWIKKTASGWSYSGTPYRAGASKIIPHTVTRRVITYYD